MNPVRTVPRALVGTSLTVLRLPADLALGVIGRDEGVGARAGLADRMADAPRATAEKSR